MGIFGFGKKKDEAPAATPASDTSAAPAATGEKTITAEPVGERDGEKVYVCQMCNQEFKQSEGNFVLEGSAFCCTGCCGSPDDPKKGDDGHEVCEFC